MKADTSSLWRSLPRLVVLLAVVAAGAELVLRLGAPPSRGEDRPVMSEIKAQAVAGAFTYAADPLFGALMEADRSRVIETPEFTYTLRTDHAGFPNPDPWPPTIDVAVLGDSLLAGPGVGHEGAFTTLLELELAGRRVMNFAVPGGGSEHELRVYRKFIQPLRPKLVVAMLWVAWDIDNTLHFDRWLAERPAADYTQYRMSFKETHRVRDSEVPAAMAEATRSLRSMLGNSHLLRALRVRAQAIAAPPRPIERVPLPDGSTVLLSARIQTRLAQDFERPALPQINEVFFRPLMQLQREAEVSGARFVVVLAPSKEELYAADAFPAVLRPWRHAKAELEARGLPTLDLYPLFRELDRHAPPFFRVDPHLNALGNQVIADALATWIRDTRVFEPAKT